jgi:DinB family protein
MMKIADAMPETDRPASASADSRPHGGSMLMRTSAMLVATIAVITTVAPQHAATDSRLTEKTSAQTQLTIASAVDREISDAEQEIVAAADAMPEDKFNFSPAALNLPSGDFGGVRTFALQVKHIAASNYAIWSPLTDDAIPDDFKGGNGPENLKTKSQILQFLKDSFALGHRAAATLTTANMLEAAKGNKSIRLHLATFAVAHAFDHYGQMVEYLRMNGIVPPASR